MDFPVELKPLQPYLSRAKECQRLEPKLSYYIKLYIIKRALGMNLKDEKSRKIVMDWMDEVENEKNKLDSQGLLSDSNLDRQELLGKAVRVFNLAEKRKEIEPASKDLALNYLAASQFFDVLDYFDVPIEDKVSSMAKYAKYQAVVVTRESKNPNPNPKPTAPEGDVIYIPPNENTPTEPPNELVGLDKFKPIEPSKVDNTKTFIPITTNHSVETNNQTKPEIYNQNLDHFNPNNQQQSYTNHQKSPQLSHSANHFHPSQQIQQSQQFSHQPFQPYKQENISKDLYQTSQSIQVGIDHSTIKNVIPDIELAKKRGKLAISALNFDDVKTALEYYELAIRALKNGN